MRASFLGLLACCPVLLSWTDPGGDTHEAAPPGALDVVDFSIRMTSEHLAIEIRLNPVTATTGDAEQLIAFVDLDTDQNPNTGRSSHIEEFGWEPYPPMGVDFYVLIMPGSDAVVYRLDSGFETPLASYPVMVSGLTVTVVIPRCYPEPPPPNGSPECIDAPMDVSAVFGSNVDGITDRFPNVSVPQRASWTGDFDLNGLVDADDLTQMAICRSGPSVPLTAPSCQYADLDLDGDVDHDDFGVFQRHFGAP